MITVFGIFQSSRFFKFRVVLLVLTIVSTIVYSLLYTYSRQSISIPDTKNNKLALTTSVNYWKDYYYHASSSSRGDRTNLKRPAGAKVKSESGPNIIDIDNIRDINNNFLQGKFPLSSCSKGVQQGCFDMAYFWSGDDLKNFLFKGFNIDAHDGLATLCVGLVGSAIAYEGLRTLRDYLLNRFLDLMKRVKRLENTRFNRTNLSGNSNSPVEGGGGGPSGSRCISTHYGCTRGGGGDSAEVSAALMRTPMEEDEDYDLNVGSKPSVSTRNIGDGDVIQDFPGDTIQVNPKWRIFSLLFMSTLVHMVYITLGYIFMLSVMTFNVWILVAVAIGVGIGQFLFGVFRRTDICIKDPTLTGNTSPKTSSEFCDVFTPSPGSSGTEQRPSIILERKQEQGDVEQEQAGNKEVQVQVRTAGVTVHNVSSAKAGQMSDYYSNSSGSGGYSRSSDSDDNRHRHSEQLTAEISVHTVATPENRSSL